MQTVKGRKERKNWLKLYFIDYRCKENSFFNGLKDGFDLTLTLGDYRSNLKLDVYVTLTLDYRFKRKTLN